MKKAENGRVVPVQSSREKLSSAESSFCGGRSEVHPGADSVSRKALLAGYGRRTLREGVKRHWAF